MTRKKITKKNINSVADQVEKSLLDAAGRFGMVTKREVVDGGDFHNVSVLLFDKDGSLISMNVILHVMMHVKRFEDMYTTIVMGAVATEDNKPAIKVLLVTR